MSLHIPSPCSASWQGMTPTGAGRHCESCDKVVVDVTAMSPTQAHAFLAREVPERMQRGEHVCVHTHADKNRRVLRPGQRLLTNAFAAMLAASVAGAMSHGTLSAAETTKEPTVECPVVTGTPQPAEVMGEIEPAVLGGLVAPTHVIRGDVVMGRMAATPVVTAVTHGEEVMVITPEQGRALGNLLATAAGRWQEDMAVPRIAPSHVFRDSQGKAYQILMNSIILTDAGALSDHVLVQSLLDILKPPAE